MVDHCRTVQVAMQVPGSTAAFFPVLGKLAQEGSFSPQFYLSQVYSRFALEALETGSSSW